MERRLYDIYRRRFSAASPKVNFAGGDAGATVEAQGFLSRANRTGVLAGGFALVWKRRALALRKKDVAERLPMRWFTRSM